MKKNLIYQTPYVEVMEVVPSSVLCGSSVVNNEPLTGDAPIAF